MKLEKRIVNLEWMDSVIRDKITDEDYFDTWLCFYPDAASDSDKLSIAKDDEAYQEIVDTFCSILKQAL